MATASEPEQKSKKPWERVEKKPEFGPVRRWLMSYSGRKWVQGVGTGITLLGAIGYVTIHTWTLDKYQEIVQFYRHGSSVPVSSKLTEMKEKVLLEMGTKERYRKNFLLFYINGWEPFLIGSFQTQGGARLGLPKIYDYESAKDVEKMDIVVEGKGVPWDSDDGRLLESALVLSDNAKKFAIAHYGASSNARYIWVNMGLGTLSVFGYMATTVTANDKLFGFLRPLSFRLVLYTVAGSLFYGVWSVLKDTYHNRVEKQSDKEAASIGLDYALGGVEYYSKIIQRNIALRALMGPSGEQTFTAVGNIRNNWLEFRQRVIPYTAKKEQMENYVEQYLASNNPDKTPEPESA